MVLKDVHNYLAKIESWFDKPEYTWIVSEMIFKTIPDWERKFLHTGARFNFVSD